MLGSKNLVVRIGGITILERLSNEHAEEFHVQVTDLLVKFIRYPDKGKVQLPIVDLQETLMAISRRSRREIDEYSKRKNTLVAILDSNLDDVNLNDATFKQINFWSSTLKNATIRSSKFLDSNMSYTNFYDAKLYKVVFLDSDLRRTNFAQSTLESVKFENSSLHRADFTGATVDNLTLNNSPAKLSIFENGNVFSM